MNWPHRHSFSTSRLSLGADAVVLLRLDEVLAQRVADPVLRHQDAAQIGVPGEDDAEQVEDLALQPVGRAPQPSTVATSGSSRGASTFSTSDGDARRRRGGRRPRSSRPWGSRRRSGSRGSRSEARAVAQEAADLDDRRPLRRQIGLATSALEVADLARKPLSSAASVSRASIIGSQAPASSLSAAGGFTSQRSRIIFSCTSGGPRSALRAAADSRARRRRPGSPCRRRRRPSTRAGRARRSWRSCPSR